jgi:hypothetical protein
MAIICLFLLHYVRIDFRTLLNKVPEADVVKWVISRFEELEKCNPDGALAKTREAVEGNKLTTRRTWRPPCFNMA